MSASLETDTVKVRKQKRIISNPETVTEESDGNGDSSDNDVIARKLRELKTLKSARGKKPARRDDKAASNGGLAQEILKELKPMLVAAISEAISSAVKKEVEDLRKQIDEKRSATAQYAQQQVLFLHYEKDNLEQYGRKDSIRISGVREQEDEKVEEVIKDIID